MYEVYSEGKVKDQFRAGYQKQNEYRTVTRQQCIRTHRRRAYLARLFSIQTKPSVHPTVVSPRNVSQLKIKSKPISVPATRAVKTMRTTAHP